MDKELKILQGYPTLSLENLDSVALLDRHDTKYLFDKRHLAKILNALSDTYSVLNVGGYLATPYQTQYFDTADHLYYALHQRGKRNRLKVRIRKYCSTGVTFLEVKYKTNTERTIKYRKEIDDLRTKLTNDDLRFIRESCGQQPPLQPQMYNAFNRITLADLSSGERLTLDTELYFRNENGKGHEMGNLVIAELKQIQFNRESRFARLAKELQIRPDSVSKYCLGVGILNDVEKKHFINVKLRRIKKLFSLT